MLRRALAKHGSNWKEIAKDDFVARKMGAFKGRLQCLALATRREQGKAPFNACRHVFDCPGFLDALTKIDEGKSSSGLTQ